MKSVTWGLYNSPDPKTVGEFELFFESKPRAGKCDECHGEMIITTLEIREGRDPYTTNIDLCSRCSKSWKEIYLAMKGGL